MGTLENLLKSSRRVPPVVTNGGMECRYCLAWKPLEDFPVKKDNSVGRAGKCRDCSASYDRNRETNDLNAAASVIARRHKQSHSGRSAKRKELASGSEIDTGYIISLWISQGGRCAVTGVQMTHISGSGYKVMTNASLDRIDNDKGYEIGNVRLVCKAVNYMKHCMTDAEMVQWCRAILDGPLVKS